MPPSKKLAAEPDRRPDAVGQDGRPLARRRRRRRGRRAARPARASSRSPTRTAPTGRSARSRGPRVPDGRRTPAWVANPIDAFILAGLDAKGLRPNPPAVEARADPPRHLRPDRPAADARGGRRVRRRPVARRLRDARRPPARLAPLRREVGPALARPRPLRRDEQLRARQPQAQRLAVPRLRHPRRSTTTSPTTASSASSSPATSCPTPTPTPSIATGYYRLGIWDDEPTDREQARFDGLDDIVATTGQVFLGLTVDCARCHDHKIDPIPQKDYYRLLSFFRNINHYRNGGPTDEAPLPSRRRGDTRPRRRPASEERGQPARADPGRIAVDRERLPRAGRRRRAETRRSRARRPSSRALIRERGRAAPRARTSSSTTRRSAEQLRAMEAERPAGAKALCVTEAGPDAPETFVLLRGNPHVPGRQGRARASSRCSATPAPVIPTPAARREDHRPAHACWPTGSPRPTTR